MCGALPSNGARYKSRSRGCPPPTPAMGYLISNMVDQGATYVRKEAVCQANGALEHLMNVSASHVREGKVRLRYPSATPGGKDHQIPVSSDLISHIELCHVFWTSAQVDQQYGEQTWFTTLVPHKNLPDSYAELHVLILGIPLDQTGRLVSTMRPNGWPASMG